MNIAITFSSSAFHLLLDYHYALVTLSLLSVSLVVSKLFFSFFGEKLST